MARYAFDLESDGFLEQLTKIHSLVLTDIETGQQYSYADQEGYAPIIEGVERLENAQQIIGHNIIKFDIPAIRKVYGDSCLKDTGDCFSSRPPLDTLCLTRLIWSDIKDGDFRRARKGTLPKKLIGSHSLKAWGYRLGNYKDDYDGGFEVWSKDMQFYCEQDVNVTVDLLKKIEEKKYSPEAIDLEHKFLDVIARQERYGFLFDVKAASELYGELVSKREALTKELKDLFPPWEVRTPFVPKVNNAKRGYQKGVKTYKVKTVEFNPGSRQHIAKCLKDKYGWKPKDFTQGGQAVVNEEVLSSLDYPEAKKMAQYFLIGKRIGQLAEGAQGWMKCEKSGRIYGSVNTNGAVTGRCTHAAPNIAQVPSVSAEYGNECRSLFTVPKGRKLVGCDASGLELRCLAHFMAKYDDGKYAKEVVDGDIHTANQIAAGLPSRNQAKTFIYAFLYGAGAEKIGSIVNGTAKDGGRLKARFLKKTPALEKLITKVQDKAQRTGFLYGLDRRQLKVRSSHAALNTLLQSAGALVMKKALILLDEDLRQRYEAGVDYEFVANVHDEFQIETREDIADDIGKAAVDAIFNAGSYFSFRCPLDGEYKVGDTWAQTH